MNKWLFSTNHKVIGILYFVLAIWSGMIESAMSMPIRLELWSCSNLINNDQIYNSLMTSNHASIMIMPFFMIMPFMIVEDSEIFYSIDTSLTSYSLSTYK